MKTAALAVGMALVMLAAVAGLRRLPPPAPDLTVGPSAQSGNPWLRPRRARM